MNRKTFIAAVLLAAGVTFGARAQDTNVPVVMDWNYFQSIGENNIFNPSRSGRSGRSSYPRHEVVVRYFTFHGTMDDRAIFTGEGAPERGYVRVGDLINGFKVMKITLDSVELADPTGALLSLNMDESMRREEDGPWLKSDQAAPLVLTPAARPGDTTSAPSASGSGNAQLQMPDNNAMIQASSGGDPNSRPRPTDGGSAADILKKLRAQRELENK